MEDFSAGSASESAGAAAESSAGNAGEAATQRTPRIKSSKLRQMWEDFYKKKWPKDPKTGNNMDACHKQALADGGTNEPANIKPMPHDEHVAEHSAAGDFARWALRALGIK